ncbi:hypothetical protein, partial [Pseudomonas kribbensis]|uniref:hypothetical protein n=1 Tax=Pseudomonas kribbensis TaxID=1628086 RepID=UPI00197D096F
MGRECVDEFGFDFLFLKLEFNSMVQVDVTRMHNSVGSLSLRERAGVGKDRVHPLRLRPGTWFTGINHGQEVLTMPWNQESPMDQRV